MYTRQGCPWSNFCQNESVDTRTLIVLWWGCPKPSEEKIHLIYHWPYSSLNLEMEDWIVFPQDDLRKTYLLNDSGVRPSNLSHLIKGWRVKNERAECVPRKMGESTSPRTGKEYPTCSTYKYSAHSGHLRLLQAPANSQAVYSRLTGTDGRELHWLQGY